MAIPIQQTKSLQQIIKGKREFTIDDIRDLITFFLQQGTSSDQLRENLKDVFKKNENPSPVDIVLVLFDAIKKHNADAETKAELTKILFRSKINSDSIKGTRVNKKVLFNEIITILNDKNILEANEAIKKEKGQQKTRVDNNQNETKAGAAAAERARQIAESTRNNTRVARATPGPQTIVDPEHNAEEKAKQEAKKARKTEAEARRQREEAEARRQKAEAEARRQREEAEARRQKAEAKAREEAKVKQKAEARQKAEAKAREEAKVKQKAEARQKAEAKARKEAAKAKQEAKVKQKAEARQKAEAAKAKAEARQKAEAEARRQREEAEARRQKAEAKAREEAAKAKQEAKVKQKAEAAKAKTEARQKAEEEAKEIKPSKIFTTNPIASFLSALLSPSKEEVKSPLLPQSSRQERIKPPHPDDIAVPSRLSQVLKEREQHNKETNNQDQTRFEAQKQEEIKAANKNPLSFIIEGIENLYKGVINLFSQEKPLNASNSPAAKCTRNPENNPENLQGFKNTLRNNKARGGHAQRHGRAGTRRTERNTIRTARERKAPQQIIR